ncbi:MAG: hypothetical protein AAF219_07210 [Myxococcota bacterium]
MARVLSIWAVACPILLLIAVLLEAVAGRAARWLFDGAVYIFAWLWILGTPTWIVPALVLNSRAQPRPRGWLVLNWTVATLWLLTMIVALFAVGI